jgi:hypothetical protein
MVSPYAWMMPSKTEISFEKGANCSHVAGASYLPIKFSWSVISSRYLDRSFDDLDAKDIILPTFLQIFSKWPL